MEPSGGNQTGRAARAFRSRRCPLIALPAANARIGGARASAPGARRGGTPSPRSSSLALLPAGRRHDVRYGAAGPRRVSRRFPGRRRCSTSSGSAMAHPRGQPGRPRGRRARAPAPPPRPAAATAGRHFGAGFTGGFLGTTTSMNGIPPALLLGRQRVTAPTFLADLAVYFVAVNALGLVALAAAAAAAGSVDALFPAALAWLPGSIAGNLAGTAVGPRLPTDVFRALTLALVLASGIAVAVSGYDSAPGVGATVEQDGHARRLAGRTPLLVELSGTDRRGHVLRLLTTDRAVLELDHRIEPLPAKPLQVGALARAHRPLHDLIRDPLIVQRLLHTPARADLLHRRAPVELAAMRATIPHHLSAAARSAASPHRNRDCGRG
jgi:hypothetical protein